MKKFTKDWWERVIATAAEALLGIVIVEFADISTGWMVPIMVLLAAGKSWLAKFIGKKDTASLASGV